MKQGICKKCKKEKWVFEELFEELEEGVCGQCFFGEEYKFCNNCGSMVYKKVCDKCGLCVECG